MINGEPPVSYEHMFEEYWGYMKSLVRGSGIPSQAVEDVTTEIFVKFMEPWRVCERCDLHWNERAWVRQNHLRRSRSGYYPVKPERLTRFTSDYARCPSKLKDRAGDYFRLAGWNSKENRHLVKRCGGVLTPPNEGFLGQFDRSKGKFPTLLKSFVTKYVLQEKDKLAIYDRREGLSLDQETFMGYGDTLVNLIVPSGIAMTPPARKQRGSKPLAARHHKSSLSRAVPAPELQEVELQTAVAQAIGSLEELSFDGVWSCADILRLFRRCVEIAYNGIVDRPALAKEFGVSTKALDLMLAHLADKLRGVGFAPELVA